MELMRVHQIRHLPVMATTSGEDRAQAIQNVRGVAERHESNSRKQLTAYDSKLRDAFGPEEGSAVYEQLCQQPDAYVADGR